MDDLILKTLRGTIDPDEKQQLESWRTASSKNEEHFQQVARIWKATTPKRRSRRPSAADIIRAANKQGRSYRSMRLYSERSGWAGPLLKIAAVLAIVVATSLLLIQSNGDAGLYSFTAAGPGTETVTLEDGTLVRLAPGASLREERDNINRTFLLDGVAFFAVRHDPNRPFIVNTDNGHVRVLGTRFEVNADANRSRVVVRDGLVAVSSGQDTVRVSSGQVAVVEVDSLPTVFTPDSVSDLLAWPNGILLFRDTHLSLVAEELSLHFERDVFISDSSMAQVPVTAWFDGESFEETIETICLITGAQCEVSPSRVIISPKTTER